MNDWFRSRIVRDFLDRTMPALVQALEAHTRALEANTAALRSMSEAGDRTATRREPDA